MRLACLALAGCGLAAGCDPRVDAPDFFGEHSAGGSSSTSATTTDDTSAQTSSTDAGSESTSTGAGSSESTEDGAGGSLCGDGLITGHEQCDCSGGACMDEGLNFLDCTTVVDPLAPGTLTGGTLGCSPASCRFDTSLCTYCGDGEVNGNETCEPGVAIETTCTELGLGTAGALGCDESCQIDTTACTDCGYLFEFDSCDEGWLTGGAVGGAATPSWACGEYTEITGGPEAGVTGVWATNLTGHYNNSESSFLRSPPLDLSNCGGQDISMTLHHWFNFEGLGVNNDGGIVQVSTDGFAWTTLTPTSGTGYGANPLNAAFSPPDGVPGFSGQSPDEQTWVDSTFDLSTFAGQPTLYVRFVFGSDGSNAHSGWYLDKLELLGSGTR